MVTVKKVNVISVFTLAVSLSLFASATDLDDVSSETHVVSTSIEGFPKPTGNSPGIPPWPRLTIWERIKYSLVS